MAVTTGENLQLVWTVFFYMIVIRTIDAPITNHQTRDLKLCDHLQFLDELHSTSFFQASQT